MPGYHYEPRKERAKLLAMHIMIASYSLAVFYRGAAFFLSERYAWLDSPGAVSSDSTERTTLLTDPTEKGHY